MCLMLDINFLDMMTMRIKYFLYVLLLPLIAACSADDSSIAEKVDGPVLCFTASVTDNTSSGGTQTRAWGDTYNTSLPPNAEIDIFLYGYTGGEGTDPGIDLSTLTPQFISSDSKRWVYQTVGSVDLSSGKSLLRQIYPTTEQTNLPEGQSEKDPDDALPKFPSDLPNATGYVDVFGVFLPPGCITSPERSAITPATTSFTFSVPTDQTTEANVGVCDLMANDVAATFRSSAASINLEMKHRMAKVLVEFNATEDLNDDNLPNNTFKVNNVQISRTVTPKTGDVSTSGGTQSITAKVGKLFFLPPQTIAAGTELLQFDLRNVGGTDTGIKNVTFKPSADFTFNEGVFYTFSLNVGIRYITLTTTIKNWTGEIINFDKIIL